MRACDGIEVKDAIPDLWEIKFYSGNKFGCWSICDPWVTKRCTAAARGWWTLPTASSGKSGWSPPARATWTATCSWLLTLSLTSWADNWNLCSYRNLNFELRGAWQYSLQRAHRGTNQLRQNEFSCKPALRSFLWKVWLHSAHLADARFVEREPRLCIIICEQHKVER